MAVYDSIDAYSLWMADLKSYLITIFPGQDVEVTVRALTSFSYYQSLL